MIEIYLLFVCAFFSVVQAQLIVDGKIFEAWDETFENSIQKAVFKNLGDYLGYGSRWVTLGTPEY